MKSLAHLFNLILGLMVMLTPGIVVTYALYSHSLSASDNKVMAFVLGGITILNTFAIMSTMTAVTLTHRNKPQKNPSNEDTSTPN